MQELVVPVAAFLLTVLATSWAADRLRVSGPLLLMAVALVSLRTAVLALAAPVTILAAVGGFVWAVVSGVVIGHAVACVAGRAFRRLELASMTTALSFLVPFAAYVPTESVHGSGVIAVVVAGLVLGHRAQVEQGAAARLAGRINWATISFVLGNSVFLLIGLQATSPNGRSWCWSRSRSRSARS